MKKLSAKEFSASSLINLASYDAQNRGRKYFRDGWRCKLKTIEPTRAIIHVHGTQTYTIEIGFNENGRLQYECRCPYVRQYGGVCKHVVASALFLENYLRHNSAEVWETAVTQILEAAGGERKARKRELLIFSLQRRNLAFTIEPYRIDAALIPEEMWESAAQISAFISENKLFEHLTKIQSYNFEPRNFVNSGVSANSLVKLVFQASSSYYGYYAADIGIILPLLKNALVFRGTEQFPCKIPLEILTETAQIEFQVKRGAEGETEFSPRVHLPESERVFQFGQNLELVCERPLWITADNLVFEVDAKAETFSRLQRFGTLKIPEDAEKEFYDKYFTSLVELFSLTGDGVEFEDVAGAKPLARLYLQEKGDTLQAVLRFGYGAGEVASAKNAPPFSIQRDAERDCFLRIYRKAEAETALEAQIPGAEHGLKRSPVYGVFDLRATVKPLDFLLKYLPKIAADGFEIYGEEDLTKHRLNRNRPQISFGITSGIDWFDVKAVINYGEIAVSLAEMRKAVRRKERFVKLADGSLGEIPAEFLEKYKHLFGLAEETENGLRVSNHHLTLLDQLLAENERVKTDREFQKRRERLKNFAGIRQQKLPKNFAGELRPYQRAGVDWLYFLREYRFGGCLADDMGLGKTVTTLCFLQSLKERGLAKQPHLLVVPRTLVFNWHREAARFAPKLKILDYSIGKRSQDLEEFVDYEVVLTTYGILLRDAERLSQYEFDTAILDEAQAIKNPLSESAKAARLIRARHRITLTGTPVENNTLELWSQFAFLNPGLLGNLDYFREEFATPIERRADEDSAKFLRKMVYPFILRRTKDQVATDLPPRTERVLYCEMETAQRKFYNQKRDYYRAKILKLIEEEGLDKSRMYVLEGLLRLRQICNHPRLADKTYKGTSAKFDLLLETLETLKAENHKALVFSQFVQMLKSIEKELKSRKIAFSYLDGKTRNRQERVDEFQQNEEIPFFLISLKAGGVGLNLTAADYVLHVDPWWNPAVEMQATDRTHRIGQDKPVFVFKFIVRDSVEEKIMQLQEKKRNLVTQLITTESSFFKNLTTDDISALFS